MKRKLIMLMGLPGSGKTTWAESMVRSGDGTVVRVNKDDIRTALAATDWVWSHEKEKDVIATRDCMIRAAFAQHGVTTVISDDTNLARKHRVALEALARELHVTFEVKRFDTPVAECIERDAKRDKPVGAKVINDMALRYHVIETTGQGYERFAKYVPDTRMPPAIICDLDGTLALNNGRRSFYDASTCDEDDVNPAVQRCIGSLAWDAHVLFVSGREELYREPTLRFLKRYVDIPTNNPDGEYELFMRSTGDYRKDWIIKGELFDRFIRDQFNVWFVLDDRDQVVNFWRYLGLACFQVAPGNF